MFNNFRDKSILHKRESMPIKHISKEECQRRILERFPALNDEQKFHNYFCSYDFRYHEDYMLEFWRDVIMFLFESVYENFAMNANEILDKTKLNNSRPLGLANIIVELINRGDYILSSSLSGEEYFKQNYPNLYKKDSWGTWLKNGMVSTIKLPFSLMTTKSTTHQSVSREFKPDELLINKRFFHSHLEGLVNLLSQISLEEDIEVLTKNELRSVLNNSNIKFHDSYLDLCLNYLSKIKKIAIFKVKIENTDMDCIKLLNNEDSSVNEKDKAIINILVQLKKIDRRLEETMGIVEECLQAAKVHLKNKNRDSASNCIKKKNLYFNTHNHYSNLKITLEQNLIDIKSMQSNQNVKNILENVVKTSQELNLNVEEFNDVAEKLRGHKENLKDAQDLLIEYQNENVNNESIDVELQLMSEQLKVDEERKQQKRFSQPGREDTIILDDLGQPSKEVINYSNVISNSLSKKFPEARKENVPNKFVDDDDLNKMLEELNQ